MTSRKLVANAAGLDSGNCPSRFRITRTGRRRFRHADTTAVALAGVP